MPPRAHVLNEAGLNDRIAIPNGNAATIPIVPVYSGDTATSSPTETGASSVPPVPTLDPEPVVPKFSVLTS